MVCLGLGVCHTEQPSDVELHLGQRKTRYSQCDGFFIFSAALYCFDKMEKRLTHHSSYS